MTEGKSFDLKRHLPSTAFVALLLVIVAAFGAIFIYMGIYNIGADAPHWRWVYNTLDSLREHSIASYSKDIKPPADLNDPKRISAGAGLYNEMCTGCHLGPGLEKSEMSQGLYPPAPELAHPDPRTSNIDPGAGVGQRQRPHAGADVLDHQAWREAQCHAGLGQDP